MRSSVVLFAVILSGVAFATAAGAEELARQEIARWNDPLTLPHTRTRCIGQAWTWGFKCHGAKCGRTKWSTCNEWATDTQPMECQVFIDVHGAEDVSEDLLNLVKKDAEDCAVVAAGAAAAGAVTSFGAAAAAAGPAFTACMKAGIALSLSDEIKYRFDQTCHWKKWSNEE